MKKFKTLLLGLAGILFGCQQAELVDPNMVGGQPMKSVTISTEMDTDLTKAALDSQTGRFSWQNGDVISVLATDGKFYDFTLTEGADSWKAEFKGSIPKSAEITTVATYPSFVANGTENTALDGTTFKYVLPSQWTWKKEVSNVPMVSTFGESADYISFKQVGGVMRFPVKNMPSMGTFELTVKGVTITGEFPIDLTKLGETAMVAGTPATTPGETPDETPAETPDVAPEGTPETASEEATEVYTETVVITYDSDVDGDLVEYNVPVPTGVYTGFNVVIKDELGNIVFTKEYVQDNKVERATLLIMSELEVPARNMAAPEVWPYFVDARVVLPAVDENITKYAVYVDGAAEPVIKEVEMVGDKATLVFGGEFEHNSTHTVAVAKVLNDVVLTSTKSDEVEFKTANIQQLKTNTGTKFVTVGWDDVAIPNGTKYENGKWSVVPKLDEKDGLKGHQRRGYQVQLLAADKTTVIYDLIPFCGHEAFTGAYSDSSWLGKVNGTTIMIPTALAFGYLEPGKDYYFRVKTLDEAVVLDETNGNYNPDGADQPYPYTLISERGGSAWSELVKLSTDAAHVGSENEILYQGFDDIMVHSDYVNWAPAVVPDLEQTRMDWETYGETNMATTYPAFLKKPASERKWTVQAFSKQLRSMHLGLHDVEHTDNTDILFNANAGSLEGWAYNGPSNKRTVYPIFGAIRLGQSGSSGNGTNIKSPIINSDKLLSNKGTKCKITANIAYCATDGKGNDGHSSVALGLVVNVLRDGVEVAVQQTLNAIDIYPEEYQSWVKDHNDTPTNYVHHQRYYEVSCELYLRNGDQLLFNKPTNNSNKGMLVIGDIKVEAIPGAYEQNEFVDNGIGTEPDNTNYDGFGLGEFPISYWWHIPTAAHNYDPTKTYNLHKEMADAGINLVLYNGEVDGSLAENKRIMDVCTELGMKFIGKVSEYGDFSDERIAAIKNNLASNPTYVGEYLVDEPKATEYTQWGDFAKRYMQEIPGKEPYVNLYPMYAPNLGASSYEVYIEKYLDEISSKTVSYDFYGLQPAGDGQIKEDYYKNLDLVRSKTLYARKPFWVITQAGKLDSCKEPTEKEQRWTVWSTIAGGSKGISYFCYWTPEGHNEYMVRRDGTKTAMYDYIQKINADINTIGKKLLPCHADGMILTNLKYVTIYDNAGKGRTNYGPVKAVAAKANHATVGCFRDARISENGDNYKGYKVLVVAQNPARDVTTSLTLDTSVTTITVTQNNTTQTVDLNNLMDVTVAGENGVKLTYSNGELTLTIPEGEALLIEF